VGWVDVVCSAVFFFLFFFFFLACSLTLACRYLREAAEVDGKSALTLQRLNLFRKFYGIVLTYVYFTRIVVYLIQVMSPFPGQEYIITPFLFNLSFFLSSCFLFFLFYFFFLSFPLLQSTIPFRYEWMAVVCNELATLAFYYTTGQVALAHHDWRQLDGHEG
jgi:hypothetical protein